MPLKMALPVRSPFDTMFILALNLSMPTLSIDSLSDLVDTHIIDAVITCNNIDNTTIRSISTSHTDPTSTWITPPTTDISPTLTVEGAPLVAFDDGIVVNVSESSNRKEMNGMNENSDSRYDSDGKIGPYYAIAGKSPSLDES